MTASPTLPQETASVLWLDHPESLPKRGSLVDIAATLRARGVVLWAAGPGERRSVGALWDEETAYRVDQPDERWPLEALLTTAATIVVPDGGHPLVTRLALAVKRPEQRVLLGSRDLSREEDPEGEHGRRIVAWLRSLGHGDDPTIVVRPTVDLSRTVVTQFGGAPREMVAVGQPFEPLDPLREEPFAAPVLRVIPADGLPVDQALRWRVPGEGRAERTEVLIDLRTRRPPAKRERELPWRGRHAASVQALLAQDERAFVELIGRTPGTPMNMHSHSVHRYMILSEADLRIIARQASQATLALPWVRAAIAERLAQMNASLVVDEEELTLCYLRLREQRDGLQPPLLDPELAARADAVLARYRRAAPGWQGELDRYFHGEVQELNAPYSEVRRAVLLGLVTPPVPPRTAAARHALSSDLFWMAAALEHGGIPQAMAVMRGQAGLGRELQHVAVRDAIAWALAFMGGSDPQARAQVLDLVERGANGTLRAIGRKAWERLPILPEGITAETMQRLLGENAGEALPRDLETVGRAGAVAPPMPHPHVPELPVGPRDAAACRPLS